MGTGSARTKSCFQKTVLFSDELIFCTSGEVDEQNTRNHAWFSPCKEQGGGHVKVEMLHVNRPISIR